MSQVSYQIQQGSLPHIFWIELQDGMLHECAVLKRDQVGSLYFIDVAKLDHIDKARLARILQHRNAANYELYDLMSQTTLNNGINGLTYFHQLVKVLSPSGKIYDPAAGVMAATPGQVAIKKTAPATNVVNPAVSGNTQVVS